MKHHKKSFVGAIKRLLPFILTLALTVPIFTGSYVCIFNALFDLPCAGCGMTRAFKALLRFDLKGAFEYHCLFPIVIFWVIYALFGNHLHLGRKTENILMIISASLFIIRWLIILFFI